GREDRRGGGVVQELRVDRDRVLPFLLIDEQADGVELAVDGRERLRVHAALAQGVAAAGADVPQRLPRLLVGLARGLSGTRCRGQLRKRLSQGLELGSSVRV